MRTSLMRASAIVAALALLLVPVSAQTASSQGDRAVAAAAVSTPSQQAVDAVAQLRGTGYWQKAACLGCVAGFLFVSGTGSVAAVILVMAAYPEVAALCAAGCYAAYAT